MFVFIIMLALVMFFIAAAVMDGFPRIGYAMTYPLRLMFPFLTMETYGSFEGFLIGSGFAFILSFEHKHMWKIGVALLAASKLYA
jgi:hypothetical protein